MSIQLSIIGGFLEAGKTTFIQNLLKGGNDRYSSKKTVLICCEQGFEEYRESTLKRYNTVLININDIRVLDRSFICSVIEEHDPDRILIEYNGTWPIGEFLKIRLPSGCCISNIYFIADASNFALYMSNMKSIMTEQISNSDIVILNRDKSLDSVEKANIKRAIKAVNRQTKVIYHIKDYQMLQGNNKDISGFIFAALLLMLYLFLRQLKIQALPL